MSGSTRLREACRCLATSSTSISSPIIVIFNWCWTTSRAGVSVGTLYQYFPNKDALLYAILLRHFEDMAEAIERVSADGAKRPLSDLADSIADVYVSVKIARPDATTALYRVAGAIDQFRLSTGVYKRLETAVVRGL